LSIRIGLGLKPSESKTLKDSEVQREVDSLCLGNKIRKLRQRRSMTLQEVSIRSGLSKSLLSQIENDASAPPLTTLIRIAKALRVKIGYFFRDQLSEQRISVVRQADRRESAKLPHNRPQNMGYHYVSLSHPMVHQRMEPFWIKFEPRQRKEHTYYQHPGEEFLYVQKGHLIFESADRTITLEPEDSLYFDSNIPHLVKNVDREPASAIAVIYTPDG
jgi:transcriptional regulator with XRE-family HTH domain